MVTQTHSAKEKAFRILRGGTWCQQRLASGSPEKDSGKESLPQLTCWQGPQATWSSGLLPSHCRTKVTHCMTNHSSDVERKHLRDFFMWGLFYFFFIAQKLNGVKAYQMKSGSQSFTSSKTLESWKVCVCSHGYRRISFWWDILFCTQLFLVLTIILPWHVQSPFILSCVWICWVHTHTSGGMCMRVHMCAYAVL